MSEQLKNWWRTAATAGFTGFTVAAGVGIGAVLYAMCNENQYQTRSYGSDHVNLGYLNFDSEESGNQNNQSRKSHGGDNGSSYEYQRKLKKLREERQKELEDQMEMEERDREKRSLEVTRKRLEEEKRLREEKQKQLENDEKMKQEEEERIRRLTRKMETVLVESFDDAFDNEIGVSTKNEYFDENFDDWRLNKHKQQLKKEYRRKQPAKYLEYQDDEEEIENEEINNVTAIMYVTNKSCDVEQKPSTNLDQAIENSQDISRESEVTDHFFPGSAQSGRKPKTEEQKAAQRQKKKLRRQRKRNGNGQN